MHRRLDADAACEVRVARRVEREVADRGGRNGIDMQAVNDNPVRAVERVGRIGRRASGQVTDTQLGRTSGRQGCVRADGTNTLLART